MSSNPQENFEFVRSLNELRLQNVGCDVVLQVGPRSFLAHRVVLMARVEYFRNMLTTDMRERKELVIPLDPEVIDPAVFGDILEYIYVFRVQFTPNNFQSICKAADFFCFQELLNKAKDYMEENVEPEAVEPLISIATGNSSKELEEECEKLLIENPSSEIARKLLIPSLSVEYLKLLMNRMGALSKHEDMFNYCIDWIKHDSNERKSKLAELLAAIPLYDVPAYFLNKTVLETPLVLNDSQCLKLLAQALGSKCSSQKLYAIGGRDGDILSSVSRYDSISGGWNVTLQMNAKLCLFASVVVDNNIYFCGGSNGNIDLNKFEVFNTETNELKTLKPMNLGRKSVGACFCDNHIYVAGGGNITSPISTFESYSIETDEWKEMAPMSQGRAGLQLVQLHGYLYAIGGYNKKHLETVERYDPEINDWSPVANMNHVKAWFGSAVLQGKIYVASGIAFEVYDPEADAWQVLPSPTACNLGRKLAAFNDRIYAIGGSVGKLEDYKGNKTVEYFDLKKQKWIRAKDMDIGRCHHSVAVVLK